MVDFHQFSRKNKFVVEIHQKNMLLCQKKVPENGGFPPVFWIFEKSDFSVVFPRFLGFSNLKFKCIFGENSCHQMVKIRWISTEFSDFRKINKYGGFPPKKRIFQKIRYFGGNPPYLIDFPKIGRIWWNTTEKSDFPKIQKNGGKPPYMAIFHAFQIMLNGNFHFCFNYFFLIFLHSKKPSTKKKMNKSKPLPAKWSS